MSVPSRSPAGGARLPFGRRRDATMPARWPCSPTNFFGRREYLPRPGCGGGRPGAGVVHWAEDRYVVRKGLCYALDVPLLAVDSLAAMAVIACDDREAGLFRSAQWESALLCPMIDARRMEVYAEVFDTSLESRSEVAAEVVTSGSFGRFIRPEGEFSFSGAVRPRRSGCFRPRVSGSSMSAPRHGGCAGSRRHGSTRDRWRIPPTSNRLT